MAAKWSVEGGSAVCEFLPKLMRLEDYDGAVEVYLEALYEQFRQDFVLARPIFNGKRLGLKRHPLIEGREATFWHLISTGSEEAERVPDLRRCERLAWVKVMIERWPDEQILAWRENRGRKGTQILLWCEQAAYLVVLEDRGDYILPWTAYYVEHEHQRKKYRKRYEEALKAGTALNTGAAL